MVAQFGTALGIAVSTLMLQWRSTEHHSFLSNRVEIGDPKYMQMLQDFGHQLASRAAGLQLDGMSLLPQTQLLSLQATLLACRDYFTAIAFVGVIGASVMLYQRLMK